MKHNAAANTARFVQTRMPYQPISYRHNETIILLNPIRNVFCSHPAFALKLTAAACQILARLGNSLEQMQFSSELKFLVAVARFAVLLL
jgi:hypothetical protein